jgi:formamidopyrimidine-DNA glycosylase
MPEWAEVKISADYINQNSQNKAFIALYDVSKGNNAVMNNSFNNFNLFADTNGKELLLNISQNNKIIPIYVFMGMSGGWRHVRTSEWNEFKFTRLRLDDDSGMSLLLSGGFLGPKYSISKPFKGSKRGPDVVKEFELFKQNVLNNLNKKAFESPIYETLLNQEYFNGIGNYLRSTILFYLDENPFLSARDIIIRRPDIIELCRDIPLKAYQLNGGQLRDWENPFNADSTEFDEWVFYQKGESIKDSNNRTFWYNKKWKQ